MFFYGHLFLPHSLYWLTSYHGFLVVDIIYLKRKGLSYENTCSHFGILIMLFFMWGFVTLTSVLCQERLTALEECRDLGQGFQLAERDMAIRGFGNIFGEQQTGDVGNVGIDLFFEMLFESLSKVCCRFFLLCGNAKL